MISQLVSLSPTSGELMSRLRWALLRVSSCPALGKNTSPKWAPLFSLSPPPSLCLSAPYSLVPSLSKKEEKERKGKGKKKKKSKHSKPTIEPPLPGVLCQQIRTSITFDPCKCSIWPETQYIQSANPHTPSQLWVCSCQTRLSVVAPTNQILSIFPHSCSLYFNL